MESLHRALCWYVLGAEHNHVFTQGRPDTCWRNSCCCAARDLDARSLVAFVEIWHSLNKERKEARRKQKNNELILDS
jgi:hypothetical protein